MRIRTTRTTRFAAALAALSLVVAACGGDDDEGADTATAGQGADTATAEPTATAEEPAPAGGEGGETIRLWLNGGDTPDELVEYAVTEFNKIHPDVEVQFERQQWTGIVEKLTTSLSSTVKVKSISASSETFFSRLPTRLT
ncbi:MAG TPA: extracellular solute-binding protein [Geminicoccaceae bacterium]|nr:extracellular solute-binding protein [Geminicoccaceae bacterium]